MILSAHQPQYIPWLGYFDKIAHSDVFVFLDDVQYKEREFQNRNKIKAGAGWIWLTVPVVSAQQGRQKVRDVRIDNSVRWKNSHWKSLRIWYAKAPGFAEHEDFYARVYGRHWEFLCELNVYIIMHLMQAFGAASRVCFESELGTVSAKTDRIVELCAKLRADVYLSGVGGKDYLDEDKFAAAGITLDYQQFTHPVYDQRAARIPAAFLPCMSALDYIFNKGEIPLKTNKLHPCVNRNMNERIPALAATGALHEEGGAR